MKKSLFLGVLGVWLMSPPKSSSPLERNAASASSSASNSPAASPDIKPVDLNQQKGVFERFRTQTDPNALYNRKDVLYLMACSYKQGREDGVLAMCKN